MDTYEIKVTEYALAQLRGIKAYISDVLQVPEISDKWFDKIKEDISRLEHNAQ